MTMLFEQESLIIQHVAIEVDTFYNKTTIHGIFFYNVFKPYLVTILVVFVDVLYAHFMFP